MIYHDLISHIWILDIILSANPSAARPNFSMVMEILKPCRAWTDQGTGRANVWTSHVFGLKTKYRKQKLSAWLMVYQINPRWSESDARIA